MLHELSATPSTVRWGYFSASLAPVPRIKSGDLIRAEAITHHVGERTIFPPKCEEL
jgi:hypothetical protein